MDDRAASSVPPPGPPSGADGRPFQQSNSPEDSQSRRSPAYPATRDTRAFAQQRAHDTHRALLQAAADLFAARGFDSTQSPDIARAAGVSVGTFYRYFADKRQAFLELMAQQTSDMFDRVVVSNLTTQAFGADQTADARRAALSHVIDVLFQTIADNPALMRVFLEMCMRDPEAARIREEFEERGRQALESLLREVAPPGRIRDPRAAAEVIHIAAQEIAVVTLACRGVAPRAAPEAVRNALSDMLYRFVFGDEPA
jgi:AcrR family transcriptional regulator